MPEIPVDDQAPWIALLLIFAAVVVWEQQAPLRAISVASLRARWPANFGLLLANVGASLVLAPLGAWIVAAAGAPTWAILPALGAPFWIGIVIVVLVFDAAQFGFHVAMHKVPIFWRFHRAHHTDVEFDVATSLRFHPFEHVLNIAVLGSVTWVLGAPAEAVIVCEIVRAVANTLEHGNVRLPHGLAAAARLVFVTSDVHRVHHSAWQPETDSNYGTVFTFWDRLFGTLRAAPRDAPETMVMGLEEFREPRDSGIVALLLLPFRGGPRPAPPVRV